MSSGGIGRGRVLSNTEIDADGWACWCSRLCDHLLYRKGDIPSLAFGNDRRLPDTHATPPSARTVVIGYPAELGDAHRLAVDRDLYRIALSLKASCSPRR